MTHLVAVLNASSRVSEAVITLRREGTRPPPLVADTLDRLADAIDADVPPRVGDLPGDEALKPVTDAVRPVLSVLGSGPQPARPGAAVT